MTELNRTRIRVAAVAMSVTLVGAACGSTAANDAGADEALPPIADGATVAAPPDHAMQGRQAEAILAADLDPAERECLVDSADFVAPNIDGVVHVVGRIATTDRRNAYEFGDLGAYEGATGYELVIDKVSWSTDEFDPAAPIIYTDSYVRFLDDEPYAVKSGWSAIQVVADGAEVLLTLSPVTTSDGTAVHLARNMAIRSDEGAIFMPCGAAFAEQFEMIAEQLGEPSSFDAAVAYAQDPTSSKFLDAYEAAEEAQLVAKLESDFANADAATRSTHARDLPPSLAGTWKVQPVWIELEDVPVGMSIVLRTATGASSALVQTDESGEPDALPVFYYPGDDEIEVVLDTAPPTGGEVLAKISISDLAAGLVVDGTIERTMITVLDEAQTLAAASMAEDGSLDLLYEIITL